MGLIKKAILRDELHLFLLGRGEYRSSNWLDLPMPNYFNKIWYTDIIPYFNSLQDKAYFKKKFKESIIRLFNYYEDPNLGMLAAVATLNWYYFFVNTNRITWVIELKELEPFIKNKLEAQRETLKNDKRWAGEEWNSEEGLWRPICNTAKFILEKYNGINFIPNE